MDDIEAGFVLLNDLPTKIKRQCIETLIKIFRNIENNPDDLKYRTLKLSNKRFNEEVWQHEGAKVILYIAGWELAGECLQISPDADVTEVFNLLIDARNVKPDEAEWVEETKTVGLSAARIREEELRKRALEQKAKDMARLKKDMAERKELAERVMREHRNDMEKRRATEPSKAKPLGSGGCAKMADKISNKG